MYTLFTKHIFTYFINLGRTRVMSGKMVKMTRPTNRTARKGKIPLNIVCSSSSGAIPLMAYIFIPTGGVIAPVSSSIAMITPNLSDVNYYSPQRQLKFPVSLCASWPAIPACHMFGGLAHRLCGGLSRHLVAPSLPAVCLEGLPAGSVAGCRGDLSHHPCPPPRHTNGG